MRTATARSTSGLSPRVRGNPMRGMVATYCSGSIPACAGEPNEGHGGNILLRVYPRVCGGTTAAESQEQATTGLSPRVRGNRLAWDGEQLVIRSIPACAGEPSRRYRSPASASVYPRVCGGTAFAAYWEAHCEGLSPRVRGNPADLPNLAVRLRSIPACAGEPLGAVPTQRVKEVYPRVCGGTARALRAQGGHGGLSPRVRGNLDHDILTAFPQWSIPACAGEPVSPPRPRCRSSVYPRVCGGTILTPSGLQARNGLSPRVRGNLQGPVEHAPHLRSIPACAGEPVDYSRSLASHSVYPRVCGGTFALDVTASIGNGLSPRVRGNLEPAVLLGGVHGSIPACAGEPLSAGAVGNRLKVYPRVCGGTGSRP